MPNEVITNFAILDVTTTCTETGILVTATTDIPCHLYMRWTTTEPQFHDKPTRKRGLTINIDRRFCFVVFTDNEQEEPGDTLIHTFIKEPWPNCQTRWYYFLGKVVNTPSPSTSPLFKHHRLCPVTIEIPALGTSGTLYRNATSYSEARGPLYGIVLNDTNAATTGQAKEGTEGFYVWRAGLFFDTTPIPPYATLLSAKLKFRVQHGIISSAIHDANQHLRIVHPITLNKAGLIPANFGGLFTATTKIGQVDRQTWLAGGHASWCYVNLDLTLAGINRHGITAFGLRGTHDINNIPDEGFIERNRYDYQVPKLNQTGWLFLVITYQPSKLDF